MAGFLFTWKEAIFQTTKNKLNAHVFSRLIKNTWTDKNVFLLYSPQAMR